jgi:ribonuclease P protein component
MNRDTLGRSERLKSEKAISELFETGISLIIQPIRLIYQLKTSTENISVKVGFVVPKKNFKRAVDRNLLKRRMREAYRLNKQLIIKEGSNTLSGLEIMLIYQGQKAEDFTKISESIKALLNKLSLKTLKTREMQ